MKHFVRKCENPYISIFNKIYTIFLIEFIFFEIKYIKDRYIGKYKLYLKNIDIELCIEFKKKKIRNLIVQI